MDGKIHKILLGAKKLYKTFCKAKTLDKCLFWVMAYGLSQQSEFSHPIWLTYIQDWAWLLAMSQFLLAYKATEKGKAWI